MKYGRYRNMNNAPQGYTVPNLDPVPHWCVAHPDRAAVTWHGHIHIFGKYDAQAGWCQECADFEVWTILDYERLQARDSGCIDCFGWWASNGQPASATWQIII